MKTRLVLRTLSLAMSVLVSLSCGSSEPKTKTPPPPPSPTKADSPGVHGMLVFGQRALFVSHLPMFGSPHDYQAIAEVKLLTKPGQFDPGFLSQPNPYGYHTIEPEAFSLPEMNQAGFRFPATLFQGHFERPEHRRLGPVVVEIKRVILFAKLDPKAPRPPKYSGIVFGSQASGEYYLAHRISGAPGFDQISLITKTGDGPHPGWEQGLDAVSLDRPDEPLKRYDALLLDAGGPATVSIREVYSEQKELSK